MEIYQKHKMENLVKLRYYKICANTIFKKSSSLGYLILLLNPSNKKYKKNDFINRNVINFIYVFII